MRKLKHALIYSIVFSGWQNKNKDCVVYPRAKLNLGIDNDVKRMGMFS